MTSDIAALVRQELLAILETGDPYTGLPLVDPETNLLAPPVLAAIREPLETSITDIDESIAQLEPAVASLGTLVEDGRLSEPNLTGTIVSEVDGKTYPSYRAGMGYKPVGFRVINPSGDLVENRVAHTLASTYNPQNWIPVQSATVKRQRAVTRRSLPAAPVRVAFPSWWTWTAAPINFFYDGYRFTHDFDIAAWMPAAGTTYYVNHSTGHDTSNNGLSEGAQFKSLNKALNTIASGDTIVCTDRLTDASKGLIYRDGASGHLAVNTRIRKSVTIKAKYPGEVTLTSASALTYSLTAGRTYTYQAARSNVGNVVDVSRGKAFGLPGVELVKKTSVADVEATPGSWYLESNTTLYVHTFDNTAPDNQKVIAPLLVEMLWADSTTQDIVVAYDGINVLGPYNGLMFEAKAGGHVDVRLNNVRSDFSVGINAQSNAFNFYGVRTAYIVNCHATGGNKDGFNYTSVDTSDVARDVPQVIEIGCTAHSLGLKNLISGANNTHNGSTGHLGSKIIRYGGKYYATQGAPLADVQTGTESLNVECIVGDPRPTTGDAFQTAISAQQSGAKMAVWNCQAFGGAYDVYVAAGARVDLFNSEYDTYYNNGTLNVLTSV